MGAFPADAPALAIYAESGRASGDGSVGAPYGTLAEAIAVAADGDTVMAAGVFMEEVVVPNGVTLRGSCVSSTVIHGAEGPLNTATVWLGEGSLIRDLTIRGNRPGLRVEAVEGSAANVRVEASGVGVAVIESGSLIADGLSVVGTTGEPGAGIFLLREGRVSIDRGWFDDNGSFGIAVGLDSSAEMRRTLVQRTRPSPAGALGMGVAANERGTVVFEESEARENRTSGLVVQDNSVGEVRTSVLRNNLSQSFDGLLGTGLIVQTRSQIRIERSLVARNKGAGMMVSGLGTHLDASDVVLFDTLGHDGEERIGIGAIFADGATAELDRVLVSGAAGLGISISGADTDVTLSDLVIRHIEPRVTDMAAGRGVDIEREARASLTRALIEDVYGSAILVVDVGTEATITDLTARALRSDARTRSSGRGLTLQFGGSVDVSRMMILNARDVGVLAYGETVSLRGSDISIDETLARECAVDTCAESRSGIGITASELSLVEVERFRVADSALAGFQIARGARLVARDGLVARNPVGVNAQDDRFDPSDVSDNVLFLDNGINLDSTALPIPEPARR
jgi:hypothetical protein